MGPGAGGVGRRARRDGALVGAERPAGGHARPARQVAARGRRHPHRVLAALVLPPRGGRLGAALRRGLPGTGCPSSAREGRPRVVPLCDRGQPARGAARGRADPALYRRGGAAAQRPRAGGGLPPARRRARRGGAILLPLRRHRAVGRPDRRDGLRLRREPPRQPAGEPDPPARRRPRVRAAGGPLLDAVPPGHLGAGAGPLHRGHRHSLRDAHPVRRLRGEHGSGGRVLGADPARRDVEGGAARLARLGARGEGRGTGGFDPPLGCRRAMAGWQLPGAPRAGGLDARVGRLDRLAGARPRRGRGGRAARRLRRPGAALGRPPRRDGRAAHLGLRLRAVRGRLPLQPGPGRGARDGGRVAAAGHRVHAPAGDGALRVRRRAAQPARVGDPGGADGPLDAFGVPRGGGGGRRAAGGRARQQCQRAVHRA